MGKEEVKLSLLTDNGIWNIGNPNLTKKLLELNELIKVEGYKINTLKSAAFLYTNKLFEGEIKKAILFSIAS